jgi:phospholipase C
VTSKYLLPCFPLILAGCSLGTPTASNQLPALQRNKIELAPQTTGGGKISHVVYVVQGGRSFDNLFQGYPGAQTVSSGKISTGKTVKLRPISLKTAYEIDTSAQAMFAACDGASKVPGIQCRMDGFNKEGTHGAPKGLKYPMYAYVPHSESKPYFDMARQWVVADHMFASQLDGGFTAHQYIVAAQAGGSVNLPEEVGGCGAPPPNQVPTITHRRRIAGSVTACFNYRTLATELDRAKMPWRFYTSADESFSSSFEFVKSIYDSPEYSTNVITPPTQFLKDVSNDNLAGVTWVTPTCADSDDVDCGSGTGPAWVAAVVNAIGESKFWDTTAVFVQWDDWGGLYDHFGPQYRDYDGPGFRVPMLVIAPYAKHGYVSHVPYETASVVRFIEDLFGLKRLAYADKYATSPAADCFDFTQKPRKFIPIKT